MALLSLIFNLAAHLLVAGAAHLKENAVLLADPTVVVSVAKAIAVTVDQLLVVDEQLVIRQVAENQPAQKLNVHFDQTVLNDQTVRNDQTVLNSQAMESAMTGAR